MLSRSTRLESAMFQQAEYERRMWMLAEIAVKDCMNADKKEDLLVQSEIAYQRYEAVHSLICNCRLEQAYSEWRKLHSPD